MAKTKDRSLRDDIPAEAADSIGSNPEGEPAREERSPERIAARAYELYLERGGSDGQDFDDWLAAERELSSGPSRGDHSE